MNLFNMMGGGSKKSAGSGNFESTLVEEMFERLSGLSADEILDLDNNIQADPAVADFIGSKTIADDGGRYISFLGHTFFLGVRRNVHLTGPAVRHTSELKLAKTPGVILLTKASRSGSRVAEALNAALIREAIKNDTFVMGVIEDYASMRIDEVIKTVTQGGGDIMSMSNITAVMGLVGEKAITRPVEIPVSAFLRNSLNVAKLAPILGKLGPVSNMF
jgi:hypothetical protein